MCDDATPPAPRAQLVPLILIGIDGLADLVAWVRAGDTLEEREQRGAFAKECIAEALASADHDSFNAALRDALRTNPTTNSISRSPVTSHWRNPN
jgi:hypothetical protein